MIKRNLVIIGVIGQGSNCSKKLLNLAEHVGRCIAKKNAILICGGLKGIMEAVCRGAKKEQGLTIGVLPGTTKIDANRYIDIPIVTGLGEARNSIIVRTADVVIAVGGRYGTLSEIAFSLALGKPIVGICTWIDVDGMVDVDEREEAVETAINLINK